MSVKLTKDADALFCLLYKSYCRKRKDGIDKFNARMFGSATEIQNTISLKWTVQNTNEACSELSRAGFLNCLYGGGMVQHCSISDNGMVYMENRFKDGLNNVLEYLAKIRSTLPI